MYDALNNKSTNMHVTFCVYILAGVERPFGCCIFKIIYFLPYECMCTVFNNQQFIPIQITAANPCPINFMPGILCANVGAKRLTSRSKGSAQQKAEDQNACFLAVDNYYVMIFLVLTYGFTLWKQYIRRAKIANT